MDQTKISSKSRMVALLLCGFLGFFGVHRFYTGKIWTGLLMACTAGGFGVWWLIDLIFIACGSFRDKDERMVVEWFERASMRDV